MNRIYVVAAAALAGISANPPARANDAASVAPSFDCSKAATETERTICGNPGLAAADALMVRLYAQTGTSAFGQGPSNVRAAQRKWLAERDCGNSRVEDRVQCLQYVYDQRNVELAAAALFVAPELALDVLRNLQPDRTPLIEAVFRYTSEPAGTDWSSPRMATKREELLWLLRPYARRFAEDSRTVYGREILADLGISRAEDALAGEKAFASFIEIASAYTEDDHVPGVMPCAALVRHPELLDATGPVFGSTLDNFVLFPDCEETLPPTPELDRLVGQLWDGWPECDGTIRYAAYRSFGRTLNLARIATGRDLVGQSVDERLPRRTAVSASQVNAAIDELTAYYVRFGRASVDDAPTLARVMVREVMKAAQICY